MYAHKVHQKAFQSHVHRNPKIAIYICIVVCLDDSKLLTFIGRAEEAVMRFVVLLQEHRIASIYLDTLGKNQEQHRTDL
jgi:hypothetical protein